jgi:hypothetical protein
MIAADQLLADALKLERDFGRLAGAETESTTMQETRRLVELSQCEYDRALFRYGKTVLQLSAESDEALARTTILVLGRRTQHGVLPKDLFGAPGRQNLARLQGR